MNKHMVYETNSSYWNTKGNDFLRAIVIPFYGAVVSEEKCQLFGNVSGKKMLEIGCGDGQSLQYQGERKAAELWGMDISEKQIEKATQHLTSCGLSAKLICSPMEEECNIPLDYFDFVYSIYAIGWTTTENEIIQLHDENNDLVKRAKMFPVTFVIKARKL